MTQKTLIIMRHCKSSWKTKDVDFKRPLTRRGTRDGVVAGQILSGYGIDLVLTSGATRARQTWQVASMGGAKAGKVKVVDQIYESDAQDILDLVHEVDDSFDTVMVVGHEPTLSDFITTMAKPNVLTELVEIKFPTAGIAVLTFDGEWTALDEGAAELSRFEIPRG